MSRIKLGKIFTNDKILTMALGQHGVDTKNQKELTLMMKLVKAKYAELPKYLKRTIAPDKFIIGVIEDVKKALVAKSKGASNEN